MYTNAIRINLLAACLLAIHFSASTAQTPPLLDESMVGIIPGTTMSRDEFRARANAQLTAVALNAEAYRLVYGEYPESFYSLYNSPAWNLDPENMFSGEPINAIIFDASPIDLIPNQEAGLPDGMDFMPTPPLTPPAPGGDGAGDDDGEKENTDPPEFFGGSNSPFETFMSVDPGNVTNIISGDVFYRTFDDTLQLLMYAPDHTYVEIFQSSPNLYWQKNIAAVAIGSHWPDDGYAGQVMYFTEIMLPRFYNHVMFMADLEVLPGSSLHMYGVEARLQMAEELGIKILNPYSKQPIRLVDTFEIGNFVETDPAAPVPLFFCFKGQRIMSLDQIHEMQLGQARQPKRGKTTRNPRRPAMGGSR